MTTTTEIEEMQKKLENHPLLPLLKSALLHCEKATWNIADLHDDDFIKELEKAKAEKIKTDDEEADAILLAGVEVLRVNYLELKKVNQLCKEFCDRYIVTIKRRMNQETLLGFSGDSDDDSYELKSPSGSNHATEKPNTTLATLQTPQGPVSVQLFAGLPQFSIADTAIPGLLAGGSGGTQQSNNNNQEELGRKLAFLDGEGENGSSKRTSLPRQAVEILKQWLFQHAVHPYPTESEKRQIALDTNLNLMQVNNWFINARRRILQPLIEDPPASETTIEGNDESPPPEKRSKSTETASPPSSEKSTLVLPTQRPLLTSAQRYWPFREPSSPKEEDETVNDN